MNKTNTWLNMNLPSVFDVYKNQFSASSYLRGYFISGDIYPNASVEAAFNFLIQNIPTAKAIKEISFYYSDAEKKGVLESVKKVSVGVPRTVIIENAQQSDSILKKLFSSVKSKY